MTIDGLIYDLPKEVCDDAVMWAKACPVNRSKESSVTTPAGETLYLSFDEVDDLLRQIRIKLASPSLAAYIMVKSFYKKDLKLCANLLEQRYPNLSLLRLAKIYKSGELESLNGFGFSRLYQVRRLLSLWGYIE